MNWLTNDWHLLMPHPWMETLLMAVSVLCGTLIGVERERKFKPAGLRTMILICLGSTVFTLMSPLLETGTGENGRVAAQIFTGVGFLGAGAILQGNGSVRGLTSAALIWATAAVGMVIGSGYGGAGVGLSVLLLLILTIVTHLEHRYMGPCSYRRIILGYDSCGGKTDVKIDHVIENYHLPASTKQIKMGDDGKISLTLTYCYAHKHHKDFLVRLAELPEIESIISNPS